MDAQNSLLKFITFRDHASRVIPAARGLMTGDRDALLFSVAISLNRIADSLEALSTVIPTK